MIRAVRRGIQAFAAALMVSACGDLIGPGDGPVDVHLETPFSDDGAVRLTLVGSLPPGVHVVPARSGLLVRWAQVADTLRIAVFGPIVSGPLVRLDMADGHAGSQIVARADAAATGTGVQRDDVSEYVLRLER